MSYIIEGPDTHQKELERIKLEELRERHRKEQITCRENRRDFFRSKARFLEAKPKSENLISQDMSVLAKSLKNKGQICHELLNNVMNGLLDDKDITKFLKVDGALQALLRLLSGQNEKFQLIAAQCICNLALGDEKQSLQVLKASESYLMAHLSGRNCYVAVNIIPLESGILFLLVTPEQETEMCLFQEACVIALGNLSRQSKKNIELLLNQGFFTKIVNILNDGGPNLEAAAVYALSQLVYHGFDVLSPESMEMCSKAVLRIFKNRIFIVAFLLSVLSSSKTVHNHFISSQIHSKALEYLLISVKEGEKESLYFLRIVSNLVSEESGSIAKDLFENHGYSFQESITLLLQSDKDYLIKECLGLVGNLVSHPQELVREYGIQIVMQKFGLFHSLQVKKFIGPQTVSLI